MNSGTLLNVLSHDVNMAQYLLGDRPWEWVMGAVERTSIVNANTVLPLDMIFFAADGRIIRIAERTVPFSTTVIYSEAPARGVVEVNGGTAERLGIRVGDKVEY